MKQNARAREYEYRGRVKRIGESAKEVNIENAYHDKFWGHILELWKEIELQKSLCGSVLFGGR